MPRCCRRRQDDPQGGDPEADHSVKGGRPHYKFKAHVAMDETHTRIRQSELSAASDHDSRHFRAIITGDERMVVADKAYWSRPRSLGHRRVRYLGIRRNRLEFELQCVVCNLRRWVNLVPAA